MTTYNYRVLKENVRKCTDPYLLSVIYSLCSTNLMTDDPLYRAVWRGMCLELIDHLSYLMDRNSYKFSIIYHPNYLVSAWNIRTENEVSDGYKTFFVYVYQVEKVSGWIWNNTSFTFRNLVTMDSIHVKFEGYYV